MQSSHKPPRFISVLAKEKQKEEDSLEKTRAKTGHVELGRKMARVIVCLCFIRMVRDRLAR